MNAEKSKKHISSSAYRIASALRKAEKFVDDTQEPFIVEIEKPSAENETGVVVGHIYWPPLRKNQRHAGFRREKTRLFFKRLAARVEIESHFDISATINKSLGDEIKFSIGHKQFVMRYNPDEDESSLVLKEVTVVH